MFKNPNRKFESMCYDNLEETEVKMLSIILKNFDSQQYIHIPTETVVAFTRTEESAEVAYAKIAAFEKLTGTVKEQCRKCYESKYSSRDNAKYTIILCIADTHTVSKLPN